MAQIAPLKIDITAGVVAQMGASDTVKVGNLGTGTPDATTLLRGDGAWVSPADARTTLGLGALALVGALTGPITSNADGLTAVASQTGTGSTFVMDTSPTITGTIDLPGTSRWSSSGVVFGKTSLTAATTFEVYGSAAAAHIALRCNNNDTAGWGTFWLSSQSSNDGILRGGSTASAYANELAFVTSGGTPITLNTANTRRVHVGATGDVGIGMVAARKLDVTGTFGATGAVTLGSTLDVAGAFGASGAAILGSTLAVTGATTSAAFIPSDSAVPTNGMYLSAANTVALATDGVSRFTVSSATGARFTTGITSSALNGTTAGIGYRTGAGSTVTQLTSKSTAVTANCVCGTITMHNAALAANTTVSFTWNNATTLATDLIVLNHVSGGTAGAYSLNAQAGAGSVTINVRNITAGSLSEAIVIGFAVFRAVTT